LLHLSFIQKRRKSFKGENHFMPGGVIIIIQRRKEVRTGFLKKVGDRKGVLENEWWTSSFWEL
jgi:hypothetical protein